MPEIVEKKTFPFGRNIRILPEIVEKKTFPFGRNIRILPEIVEKKTFPFGRKNKTILFDILKLVKKKKGYI